jgi:arylsulfatase A-like enzyme
MGIPAQHPTLASYLGDLGYYTALVGKWHAGYGDGADPMSHGYREFFGYNDSAINYYTHRDDAGRPQLLEGATTVEREGYVTDLLTERAVRIIRARCRKDAPPLFLSLHHAAPHWPWLAPGDQVEARRIRRRSHFDGGSLQTYAHMIESLDRGVGEVLAALEASGAARDTLVVFTSDNGGERFSDLWPLRGGKGSLLEGGIRVPALLRWPARLRSGRSSNIPNITMGLTATILAAAGVTPEIPYALDGIDLQPSLTGDAPPPDRILHWRMKARAQAACVAGNWKYLRIEGNEFLFDLGADPREVTNRRSAEPARFERLKSAQQKWESEMLPLDDGVIPYGNSAADLAS